MVLCEPCVSDPPINVAHPLFSVTLYRACGIPPVRHTHTHTLLMELSLIYNPSLSSSAGPASVPCTDPTALPGQFPCGLLALVFQHAGQV